MLSSFNLSHHLLPRLSKLHLACDQERTCVALMHISMDYTGDTVRFVATDGKILAVLLLDLQACTRDGEPFRVMLDGGQLVAGLKLVCKGLKAGEVSFTVEGKELVLSSPMCKAVVRLVDCRPLNWETAFTRHGGKTMLPACGSIAPKYAAIAQEISGNPAPLLFATPVPALADDAKELTKANNWKIAANGPAFWRDHSLAILIMNITRPEEKAEWDLDRFAILPASRESAQVA